MTNNKQHKRAFFPRLVRQAITDWADSLSKTLVCVQHVWVKLIILSLSLFNDISLYSSSVYSLLTRKKLAFTATGQSHFHRSPLVEL